MDVESTNSQQTTPDLLTAKSIDLLVAPSVSGEEHKLQYSYSVWFTQRSRGSVSAAPSDYEDQIKHVGAFSSVEQFWSLYCYMSHPCDLPPHCDIHVFKMGIKPMWEDPANKDGGKWIVRLKKEISSRCWENLLLAMLGEQFIVGNEICGAVISVRPAEDIISIWNRTASDSQITAKIRDTLTRVMQLPSQTVMEYKAHDISMKDKSSFRNTERFVR